MLIGWRLGDVRLLLPPSFPEDAFPSEPLAVARVIALSVNPFCGVAMIRRILPEKVDGWAESVPLPPPRWAVSGGLVECA